MVLSRLLTLALLLAASAALAGSPYEHHTYPNRGRDLSFNLSAQWLLLDAENLPANGLKDALTMLAPGAHIRQIESLVTRRTAVRIDGLDAEGLRQLGRGLVAAGLVARTWPAVTRETGVAFFDDRLAIAFLSAPAPDALAKLGVTLRRQTGIPGVWAAQADDGDAVGAAIRLAGVSNVRWAEPDLLRHVKPYGEVPTDPEVGAQWHLDNDEDVGDINAGAAWAITTGDPTVIMGVFDTGTDLVHADLVDNVVGGIDAVSGDDDPQAGCGMSPDGSGAAPSCPANAPYRESHGTAVSGVIAARGTNGVGGTGVCPDCSLYLGRLLGGTGMRALSAAEAFQRASDDGVWAINNSWGPGLSFFFPLSTAEQEVFDRITTEGRDGKGVVLLFAAGNDYFTPADGNPYVHHPGTIAVSASTRTDDFACYSNIGTHIGVAGPSQGCFSGETGIVTTDYTGPEGYADGDLTTGFSGTSAATPVVTGVVGLVLAANPELTADQVQLILHITAEKIRADKNPWAREFGVDVETLFEYDAHGFSQGFGYGRVDAGRAVALAVSDPPLTGARCDDACPQCDAGRCAPACETDAECPGAARCLELSDGARGCGIPRPNAGDLGQPCTADCNLCVSGIDSDQHEVRQCSHRCGGDEDCPFGFDCRPLGRIGSWACVPGFAECGSPWNSERCYSGIRVKNDGADTCGCECIMGAPGACPEGFMCSPVSCQSSRGAILCEPSSPREANYLPSCVPDPSFRPVCESHSDCAGGLYCIDGLCAADLANEGCDTCAPCAANDDCSAGTTCTSTISGDRCLYDCLARGDRDCRGDSVCRDLPGVGMRCVNPEFETYGVCPADYRCTVEGRCFDDGDCEYGACEDGVCPTPPIDAEVVEDMGVADAALPDATRPDAAIDTEREIGGSGGCQSAPGTPGSAPLFLLPLLGAALLRRRTV